MLKKVYGSAVFGVEAHTITVEVNVDNGIGYHLVEVTPVPFEKLTEERRGESSIVIRQRVTQARQLQTRRFENLSAVHYNAQMQTKHIRKFCVLDEISKSLLKQAMERLNLSARAYDRILKVARTIADLESSISIESRHISEAIQYRSLDREGWLD